MSRPPTSPGRPALAWSAGLLLVVLQVLSAVLAGPASAHAELTGSSPENGSSLERAPAEVTLTFTEDVDLVDGGLRLVDSDGGRVATPTASVDGHTVHWPMPADLPDGSYVADWRVISSDSHPVAGAVAFGVGTTAGTGPGATPAAPVPAVAPWPVVAARFLGYAGLAMFLGGFAFVLFCWPRDVEPPARTGHLMGAGLLAAVVATVLGLLVQGPYLAGLPMREATDLGLLRDTGGTTFGSWMQVRAFLYLALAGLLWGDRRLALRTTRWLGGVFAVLAAVTFSGTGHAAASGGLWDRGVDTVHVLAAGTWVGGLLLLALTLRGSVHLGAERDAVVRFSRLALGSVVVLVVTGTLNAVIHLDEVADLWRTRYGITLLVKLAVVVVALGAAAVSRGRVRHARSPRRSVRVEAVGTSVVLAVTAVLTMTAPPPTVATPAPAGSSWLERQQAPGTTKTLDLGDGRSAALHVAGLRPGGSLLHLELEDADGAVLAVNRVELALILPSEDLGPFTVPLREGPDGWSGSFSFALPGVWTATLTVEDQDLAGIVTTAKITIVE